MFLWLDDIRDPAQCGAIGVTWVKTYDEAVDLLKTGNVIIADLDHDLNIQQTLGLTDGNKTGYDVIVWMEEHNIWPEKVLIHSQNPSGKYKMLQAVQRHYGKLFQPPFRV